MHNRPPSTFIVGKSFGIRQRQARTTQLSWMLFICLDYIDVHVQNNVQMLFIAHTSDISKALTSSTVYNFNSVIV